MKVSIITMQFPSPSETFASNDIRVMKELGVDINVFGMKPKYKYCEQLIDERNLSNIPLDNNNFSKNIWGLLIGIAHPILLCKILKYILFTNQRRFSNYLKLILLLPSAFYIFDKVKNESPDIVHLFWGHYPSLLGLLIKDSKVDTKVTMFLGAYDFEYNLGISEKLIKKCDKLFTHSNGNKKILLNRYNLKDEDITVFYRGVDLNEFKVNDTIIKEKNSFITIGRLIDVKRQEDVIFAFSRIIKIVPSATLKIIGNGSNENKLKDLVDNLNLTNSITFLGHIPHNIVFQYLERTEYFLFMSIHDGERLPNVVKEAMLAKNICIVTKTQDIEELITDKKDGFIVDYYDIDSVVEIFNNIFNETEEQKDIRYNANIKINNLFNVRKSIYKIINVWSKII